VYYSYLQVNTTAVKSGGIVRAVIPIENAAHERAVLDQTDFMGYCDPNGAGDLKFSANPPQISVLPHVRWSYGRLYYGTNQTVIEGWLPTAGLTPRPAPPGSDPNTPDTSPVMTDPNVSDPDCDTTWAAPKVRVPGFGYSN
jgi:hypothetical protein